MIIITKRSWVRSMKIKMPANFTLLILMKVTRPNLYNKRAIISE